jgi:homoserine dehydrogenase
VDVVLELIGGIEPARSLVLEAMEAGKSVVTANKALLSEHGPELFDEAVRRGVDLLYEAAVGGGIPVIRVIREHLAGDRVVRLTAILNGTTNYILTRMTEEGSTQEDAVREAQALGYAEADPTADVGGHDAAAKAAILATIAFDTSIPGSAVYREGIEGVSAEDIAFARRLGYVVKLLAVAERVGDAVSVRVQPAMLPAAHPLAAVRESFNAVLIEGERVGPLMLYGRGAGGDPTATSVVGDLIELARGRGAAGSITMAGHGAHGAGVAAMPALVPMDDVEGEYYLLLEVADRPGVLAAIAHAFAHHQVSIRQVWQEGHGDEAQLVLITHRAAERTLRECVRTLRGLGSVKAVRSVIRVEASEA